MMLLAAICLCLTPLIALFIVHLMEAPEKRRKKEWDEYWEVQLAKVSANHEARWQERVRENTIEIERLSKPYLKKYPVTDPNDLRNCFVLERPENAYPRPYYYDKRGFKYLVDLEKGTYSNRNIIL